jgi:hypothetical protein
VQREELATCVREPIMAVRKLKQKNGETLWTLPYPSGEDTVNDPLFDGLPQIHIAQLLQFVDRRCYCLDAFTNILRRYVKTTLDRQSIVACLIAYGTNNAAGLSCYESS